MGTRRKSRELLLKMLFQSDMGKQAADDVRRTFWSERNAVVPDVRGFAEDPDTDIGPAAGHWKHPSVAGEQVLVEPDRGLTPGKFQRCFPCILRGFAVSPHS